MEPPTNNQGATENQALNDIQDYLENFNKEISVAPAPNQFEGQQAVINQFQGAGDVPENSVGMVNVKSELVHQTEGEYPNIQDISQSSAGTGQPLMIVSNSNEVHQSYIPQNLPVSSQQDQNLDQNSVVQVLQSVGAGPNSGGTTGQQALQYPQDAQLVALQNAHDSSQPQYVAVQGGSGSENDHRNLDILADASQQNAEINNGQILNNVSGQPGQYQTLTIVPSDGNQSGDISYVLIVSQGDENKPNEEDVDMSVYDFREEPKDSVMLEDGVETVEDSPKRVIKLLPKRPQITGTQLMCNYCNYTSPKKYLLTRHMKTHSDERPHKCNICDRGFKTIASLQNHVNTHTGTKPHKCKDCESAFTTSGELVRHVRYRHTHEKPHHCTECDYCSVELSKLKRHMRSHTGERPYLCPHCSYASPDTFKLKRHLRIHTGEKPYVCDICQARFTQSNSLKAHRLIHSGAKPVYQCELCPTTCGRKTDLKIHIQKLHTSDKPLQCRKCGKSFPDRYTFKIHMKTHEGEKCYKCELCPYAALSERHLQSHLLTHTGEKPFECDQCEQSFRQKQLLKRHKNLYHTPDYRPPTPKDKTHECRECEKVFAHKGNLLRHMAMHDPESPMYQPVDKEEVRRRRAQRVQKMEQGIQCDTDDHDEPQSKTVMIEVTQEGSQQQMFLLMEVPPGADELTEEQIAEAQANMAAGKPVKGAIITGGGLPGAVQNDDESEEESEDEEEDEEEMQAIGNQPPMKRSAPAATASTSTATESVAKKARNSPRGIIKKSTEIKQEMQIKKDIEECFGFEDGTEGEESKPSGQGLVIPAGGTTAVTEDGIVVTLTQGPDGQVIVTQTQQQPQAVEQQ